MDAGLLSNSPYYYEEAFSPCGSSYSSEYADDSIQTPTSSYSDVCPEPYVYENSQYSPKESYFTPYSSSGASNTPYKVLNYDTEQPMDSSSYCEESCLVPPTVPSSDWWQGFHYAQQMLMLSQSQSQSSQQLQPSFEISGVYRRLLHNSAVVDSNSAVYSCVQCCSPTSVDESTTASESGFQFPADLSYSGYSLNETSPPYITPPPSTEPILPPLHIHQPRPGRPIPLISLAEIAQSSNNGANSE